MTRNEVYTPGTTANAVSFMARRRAATHAAFLLPHLKTGDRILDCGCGPGYITRDLAVIVGPSGAVVGIDRSIDQANGMAQAAAAGSANIHFQAASIYALPFSDNDFDVVFAHALIEHLNKPESAIMEVMRVLKPGGLVALRSPDWGGFLLEPFGPKVEAAIRRYEALVTNNGGDIHAGRKLAGLLRKADAERIEPSASYEIYESAYFIADYLAQQLDDVDADAAATLRDWGCNQTSLFAQAWGEALALKPLV